MEESIVEEWLRSLHLGQYADSFVENGYDDLEICKQIGEPDLDAIGVFSANHRSRILEAVKSLREDGAASVYFTLEEVFHDQCNVTNAGRQSNRSSRSSRSRSSRGSVNKSHHGDRSLVKIPRNQIQQAIREKLITDGIRLGSPPYTNTDGSAGNLGGLASCYADQFGTHYADVLEILERLRMEEWSRVQDRLILLQGLDQHSHQQLPSPSSQSHPEGIYVPGKYSPEMTVTALHSPPNPIFLRQILLRGDHLQANHFQPSSCLSDAEEEAIYGYGFGYGVYGAGIVKHQQRKRLLLDPNPLHHHHHLLLHHHYSQPHHHHHHQHQLQQQSRSLSPGNFSRAPYQPPPSSNEDEKRGKKRGTLRKIFRTLGRRDRDRGRRDRDRDRRDRDGEDPHPLSLPYEYNHSSHSQPTDDILDSSVAADPLITPAPPSLVLPPVPERRWYMESENRIPITEAIQRYKQIERQKRLDREARSDERLIWERRQVPREPRPTSIFYTEHPSKHERCCTCGVVSMGTSGGGWLGEPSIPSPSDEPLSEHPRFPCTHQLQRRAFHVGSPSSGSGRSTTTTTTTTSPLEACHFSPPPPPAPSGPGPGSCPCALPCPCSPPGYENFFCPVSCSATPCFHPSGKTCQVERRCGVGMDLDRKTEKGRKKKGKKKCGSGGPLELPPGSGDYAASASDPDSTASMETYPEGGDGNPPPSRPTATAFRSLSLSQSTGAMESGELEGISEISDKGEDGAGGEGRMMNRMKKSLREDLKRFSQRIRGGQRSSDRAASGIMSQGQKTEPSMSSLLVFQGQDRRSQSSVDSAPSGSGSSTQPLVQPGSNRSSFSMTTGEESGMGAGIGTETQVPAIQPVHAIGRARALVNCTPNPYDRDALRFKKGDIIEILSKSSSGLWTGRIGDSVGTVKFISVEMIPEDLDEGGGEDGRDRRRRTSRARTRSSVASSHSSLESRPGDVEELLKAIHLEEHISLFKLQGYDTLEELKRLDDEELDYLGIKDLQQRQRILDAVDLLHAHEFESEGALSSGEESSTSVARGSLLYQTDDCKSSQLQLLKDEGTATGTGVSVRPKTHSSSSSSMGSRRSDSLLLSQGDPVSEHKAGPERKSNDSGYGGSVLLLGSNNNIPLRTQKDGKQRDVKSSPPAEQRQNPSLK